MSFNLPNSVRRLASNSNLAKMGVWDELRPDATGCPDPSLAELQDLFAFLDEAQDEDIVFRKGVIAFLSQILWRLPTLAARADQTTDGAGQATDGSLERGTLAHWLWDAFNAASAAFATSAGVYTRDEGAVIYFSRRLGFGQFPKAGVHHYPAGKAGWQQRQLKNQLKTICLIGRPGLHGEEAVEQLSNKQARFSFPDAVRPEDLQHGQLDPARYHRIKESVPGRKTVYHTTEESDTKRYDYGLVQRYTIDLGGRQVIVVNCAGGSSLGTLAAAQWATLGLTGQVSIRNSRPIPIPEAAGPDSCMEALLSVTADKPKQDSPWEPSSIMLDSLIFDNYVWSPDDCEWQVDPVREVTLVYEGQKEPVAILFDGERTTLQPAHMPFRLLVAVALEARDNNGLVDPERLAKNENIWGQGKTLTVPEVRRKLSTIKSRNDLNEAMSISAKEIRFYATVKVQR